MNWRREPKNWLWDELAGSTSPCMKQTNNWTLPALNETKLWITLQHEGKHYEQDYEKITMICGAILWATISSTNENAMHITMSHYNAKSPHELGLGLKVIKGQWGIIWRSLRAVKDEEWGTRHWVMFRALKWLARVTRQDLFSLLFHFNGSLHSQELHYCHPLELSNITSNSLNPLK